MGVGKTVYKGEVKTGVVAWLLSRIDPYENANTSSLNLALAQTENSDATFAAPKLTHFDGREL
jgi:hypothetical protein